MACIRLALRDAAGPEAAGHGMLAELGSWTDRQVKGSASAEAGTAQQRVLLGFARLSLVQAVELAPHSDVTAPVGWILRLLTIPEGDAEMLRDAARAEQVLSGVSSGRSGVDAQAWIRIAEAGLGRWPVPGPVSAWAGQARSLDGLHELLAAQLAAAAAT